MLTNKTLFFALCCSLAFGVGCGDDDTVPDTGTDMDVPDGDTPDGDTPDGDTPDGDTPDGDTPDGDTPDMMVLDPTCENYCTTALDVCDGHPNGFVDMAQCMTWCGDIGAWEAGTAGDDSGDTISCRQTALAADDCDAGGFTGGNVCGTYCENYCNNLENTCEGSDAVYENTVLCLAACMDIDDDGIDGTIEGDSIQCRIYHGGIPADMNPETHCPHTAPDGGGVCVFDNAGYDFVEAEPEAYTRRDRLGMPAVSTALAGMASTAYNAGDPSDDVMGDFVPTVVANLTAIHESIGVPPDGLDPDLEDAGLVPCDMGPTSGSDSTPICLTQPVTGEDGGPSVASLVIPDTITLDTSADSGFPNGRLLTDPVIDVTLAVILLDLTVESQSALTFATAPVGPINPPANDHEFLTEFPYLAEIN